MLCTWYCTITRLCVLLSGDSFSNHNGMYFSTQDQEHDLQPTDHCAVTYKGAWWYNTCHLSNLNGQYLHGVHTTFADGVNWKTWHGYYYSLKTTEMKVIPIRGKVNLDLRLKMSCFTTYLAFTSTI